MDQVLGIDIAKAKFDVYLWRGSEQKGLSRTFENNTQGFKHLHQWLSQHSEGRLQAGMEATGIYGEDLAEFLHEQGYEVSVVNPARISAYGESQLQRNKTDQLDARLIADFCRKEQPPLWTPPASELRELQALVRYLDDLKGQRQQQRNRLEAQRTSQTVRSAIEAHLAFLDGQIEQVLSQITEHVNQHPHLKQQRDLLASIPGLGNLSACQIIAAFADLTRFDNVRQVVAFAGLNPQQRRSGSSLNYTAGISRCGSKSLRAALYMPALVAMRHNPLLKAFAQRLAKRGLKPKQVIVAVMRKLLHLAFGVLKSQQPFDPHYLDKAAAVA